MFFREEEFDEGIRGLLKKCILSLDRSLKVEDNMVKLELRIMSLKVFQLIILLNE